MATKIKTRIINKVNPKPYAPFTTMELAPTNLTIELHCPECEEVIRTNITMDNIVNRHIRGTGEWNEGEVNENYINMNCPHCNHRIILK